MRLHATIGAIDLRSPIADVEASLPGGIRFDSTFPSFCFALATGVGKTKLLASAIAYLQRNAVSRNFFVLAPGETIYSKLIRDFTQGSKTYVFSGIAGVDDVRVITGDDYLYRESQSAATDPVSIYIFNIQKLLSGSANQRYRFHSFQETLGASFAERIREKEDLVVLMDESHRYRGPEYFAAIADLKPMVGLEFTATPAFMGNVIFEYALKQAISDGWVKKIRPIYRRNDASLEEELDELKLRDGLLVHEATKLELSAYADAYQETAITPMVLINLPLISQAESLKGRLEGELGYAGKVLLIHSRSDEEDEQRLVELEDRGDVEIVLHVSRLREGWDVRNIFTIIPLRASISETLTAQTIGRGVRLPFAANNRADLPKPDVATLSVICYQRGRDNYARIIDAAKQLGPVEPQDAGDLTPVEKVRVGLTHISSRMVVPSVVGNVKSSAKLTPFVPSLGTSIEAANAELVGVDLEDNGQDELGVATQRTASDPLAQFAESLLDKLPEISPGDFPVVARIVKDYLRAATESDDDEEWKTYLDGKRRHARDDLLGQLREHIHREDVVTYEVTTETLTFTPFETVLPVGSKVRPWAATPNDEIRRSLVGGYEKTVFEGFRFDSQQEKWLADALARDTAVVEWLKVPEGQLAIRTPAGRYLPDFIAISDAVTYLIEVKRAVDVENRDPGVVEKARRARQWCETVSASLDTPWTYRLLRHDRIKEGDTLQGMLAASVNVEEFIKA
jgi:superfamily II DNA or RNA helicase